MIKALTLATVIALSSFAGIANAADKAADGATATAAAPAAEGKKAMAGKKHKHHAKKHAKKHS